MLTQISASSPAVPIHLLNNKKVPTNERLEELRNGPEILTPPGMKEIKMVELFIKWCSFVPIEYCDEICHEPPKYVIEKVKKDRSKKAAQ
jgi:hypothetical protein